jgi:Holliday junction resolvase RusA-like endonuclease
MSGHGYYDDRMVEVMRSRRRAGESIESIADDYRKSPETIRYLTSKRVVSLYIPGQPVAKGRPRITTRGGKPRGITPEKTRGYEAGVAAVALAKGHWILAGPLRVEMVAVFARPKRIKADGRTPHDKRPDLDNIVKSAIDGLARHFDDGQVVEIHARKFYAARGEEPHAMIIISEAT